MKGNEYGILNAASHKLIHKRLNPTDTSTNTGCLNETNNNTAIQNITIIAITNEVPVAINKALLFAVSPHAL